MKRLIALTTLLTVLLYQSVLAQDTKMIYAFTRSLDKEKNKDYPGAIKAINDLGDSTSYEVILRLGWLNYKAGHKKKSVQYYEKAIDLMPKALEPRIGYGYPAYELENTADLIEQDKKILAIDPNNKTINSNLGYIYYYDKQYKNALPHFQKVVELYPFDYDNNLMLGWTLCRLGQKAEAEKYFMIALLYSPADVSAKEGMEALGKTVPVNDALISAFSKSYELAAQSDNKGAANALKEVYDKSSYFINLRLGWLSHLSGSEMEAASYYKIATELKPNSVEARLGAIIPAEAMGNKNDVKAQCEAILIIDPQNTLIHYKLGMLYYSRKEFAPAFDHFKVVVDLYPFDYDGLLMFAWVNWQTGKNAESRIMFSKVMCLSPDDSSARLGLTMKPVEEQKVLEQKQIIRPK